MTDVRDVFGELADKARWVAWREERRGKDVVKVPISPVIGSKASTADPATWGTLEAAERTRDEQEIAGVGIVLGDGLGGVDLDGCRDPETGELAPWATGIVEAFNTYTEVSPSGTGLKLFAAGAPRELPAHRLRVNGKAINGKDPGIEAYTGGRYFTVTGHLLDGVPDEIRDAGELGDACDRLTRRLAETKRGGQGAGKVSERIPSGSRNATLTSIAGSMRRRGLAADEIRAALEAVNERRCMPPLDVSEVGSIAASVGRYEPQETIGRPTYTGPPGALADTLAVFSRWLHLPDLTPVLAVLATVAANKLEGDPVWLGLVAPPSSAKTEILNALSLLPDLHATATLTPASLLSGTPKKSRAKDAKGGLLREIGDFGILVMKDFGSVLTMHREARGEVLAALREIYDGAWTRHLGTDGGLTLSWQGKVGLVFGATPALDSHHAVIGTMGERFLLCRLEATEIESQAASARLHAGKRTGEMRRQLAEATAALFAGASEEARELSEAEGQRLDKLACRAVQIRSTVERDRYSREIENVHGVEGPARLVLALERLLAGLDVLGVERPRAFEVVRRVAMDSVPTIRRDALRFVEEHPDCTTKAVAEAVGLPTTTVRRALEDLAAYQLVKREGGGQGTADRWKARTP